MNNETGETLGALAAAYGVPRSLDYVTDAIIGGSPLKRALGKSGRSGRRGWRAVATVVGILIQDPSNLDRIAQGRALPTMYRDAMRDMVNAYSLDEPADDIVNCVLANIESVLDDPSHSGK